jgi:hypothetical protein
MLQKLVVLLAIMMVCVLNLVRPVDPDGANSIRGGQTLQPLYPKVLQPTNPNEPTYCNAIEVLDNSQKCSGTPAACSKTPRQSARYGEPGSERINKIHIQNNLNYCGDINCVGNHYELSSKNPCTHAATPDPMPNWPVVGSQKTVQ